MGERPTTVTLRPYPEYEDASAPWLTHIPEDWQVRRLRHVAELRVSNVDKHTVDTEVPVRLCNYVDVYKNAVIRPDMPFMRATASPAEVAAFRIRHDDVLITKDSEDWSDIGVPAYVEGDADDLLCGYHLAILRPHREILGRYLYWQFESAPLRLQFSVEATGVTRYGLSHGAIKECLCSAHHSLNKAPSCASSTTWTGG